MGFSTEKEERYTYADYLTWDDNHRWEIINGKAINMPPAPSRKHQALSVELVSQIHTQLKGKTCEVYHAPFDVRLVFGTPKEGDIDNVVQPDISVICDPAKLDDKGCLGAPDLVIEILSPSTSRKDKMDKFFLYEHCGVKEYWLISPDDKMVEVFKLGEDGSFGRPDLYSEKDTVKSHAVKGLIIDLNGVLV